MDRNGELSNRSGPRVVFCWEHILAQIEEEHLPREDRLLRKQRWSKALDLWTVNGHMRHVLTDIQYRQDINIDVLCSHPPGFARKLRNLLDDSYYPYNRLYCAGVHEYARELVHHPEVAIVFVPRQHQFVFGGRGRVIPDPDHFSQII